MSQVRTAGRSQQQPSPMGERILAFMSANYVVDADEFAQGVVGVPAETFKRWIYDHDIDPRSLPVAPLLLCAEALGTNPEYLTCISDDPRPGVMLTYDEGVLLQAFRDIAAPRIREELLRIARDFAVAHPAPPNSASPFTRAPIKRPGPANET